MPRCFSPCSREYSRRCSRGLHWAVEDCKTFINTRMASSQQKADRSCRIPMRKSNMAGQHFTRHACSICQFVDATTVSPGVRIHMAARTTLRPMHRPFIAKRAAVIDPCKGSFPEFLQTGPANVRKPCLSRVRLITLSNRLKRSAS